MIGGVSLGKRGTPPLFDEIVHPPVKIVHPFGSIFHPFESFVHACAGLSRYLCIVQ